MKSLPLAPEDAGESLPPLYQPWVRQLFGAPIPRETRAPCDDCAMQRKEGAPPAPSSVYYFGPGKCCTYMPELPSFLAGRILRDDDPAAAAGRASIEARMAAGIEVSPLGLGQSTAFEKDFEQRPFGRSDLRCPHYIEAGRGSCAIWRHRNSTCTTFFCKHERGALGKRFWHELHLLLNAIERELSRFCIARLDVGKEARARLCPPSGEWLTNLGLGPSTSVFADPAVHRAIWGNWTGREREFYVEAARAIDPLSWPEVVGLCGTRLVPYLRATLSAWKALTSEALPRAPRVTAYQTLDGAPPGETRVVTYNAYDAIDVPAPLLAALRHFDGRPATEALDAIRREDGLDVDPAVIRRLIDFDVLVP